MVQLLSDAVAGAWSVDAPKSAQNMQLCNLKLDGKTAVVQLVSKDSLGSVTTPWRPSLYKGTGLESRVTVTFSIPEEVRVLMETIEEKIREGLKKHVPRIESLWHSTVKPEEKHPCSMKSKIVISGEDACPCFNSKGEKMPMPTEWTGLSVIPIIEFRAVYLQKTLGGLVSEVVGLLVGDIKPVKRREIEASSFV